MASYLAQRVAWLRGRLKTAESIAVTYVAGEDEVALQATKGRSLDAVDGQVPAAVRAEVVDWLIDTADLVIDGETVVPEPGHQVLEVDAGGVTWTYEVMALDDEEPCWRWSDPYRTTRRLHTKLVDDDGE